MDDCTEVRAKLEELENAKFVNVSDYNKCSNDLTFLQHELSELYEFGFSENKHHFVQANLNLFLYVIENIKKEVRNQCLLRFDVAPIVDRPFDFLYYYKVTRQTYFVFMNLDAWLDMPGRIRRIIKKQDDVIETVQKLYAKFLVEFYREPLTIEMAEKASRKLLDVSDFWVKSAGEGSPLLVNYLKECESVYIEQQQNDTDP